MVFTGAAKAQYNKQQLLYYNAYMSGLFSQQYDSKKYPKYEDNEPRWGKKTTTKKQDWKQQKQIVQAMNAAFGGTTTKRTK